jgi:hypothetical protein
MLTQLSQRFVQLINEAICGFDAIVGYVIPDFNQIQSCAWSDAQTPHLFSPLGGSFLARCLLEFIGVEGCCRAAFQTFPNVLTKSLKFQGPELVFQFEQPQGFANNLTRGTIGARGNLFADHLLKARGKADIHRHEVTSKGCNPRICPLARIVNLWQEMYRRGWLKFAHKTKTAAEGFHARVPPSGGFASGSRGRNMRKGKKVKSIEQAERIRQLRDPRLKVTASSTKGGSSQSETSLSKGAESNLPDGKVQDKVGGHRLISEQL